MLPSAWPLHPHQGYARKYRNIQSMFRCGRIYYIFFGTGALPKRRFTLLYIGTNYSNHQVIAAQITVGWERFGKKALTKILAGC